MIQVIKEHISVFIFVLLMLLLSIGVVVYSGTAHIDKLLLVTASMLLFYWLFQKIGFGERLKHLTIPLPNMVISKLDILLLVVCFAVFLLDMVMLSGPPGFKAFSLEKISELTKLRGSIHESSPKIVAYLSAFNLRAFIPFAILHFLIKKRTVFVILLVILASFYGFAMMQKSYILSMTIPGLIYVLYKRDWKYVVMIILSIGAVLTALTMLSVSLENDTVPAENSKVDNRPKVIRIAVGLTNRIFIVPGEIVSEWFDHIPEDKPFLNGDGYPLIAKLKGHEFRNYNVELYPIIRPDYVKRGLTGTVNVATFVREYANFGYYGLAISGLILALFFYLLQSLFHGEPLMFACINLFPILLLSSSSLLTILVTGGWALMIVLYMIYRDQYKKEEICVA